MHLTLRQLEIFVAIAECGSTTAASQRIALSQSATSGALNELEALLDARLFDRVGRRLLLNESGRVLLPQARLLLESARDIERQYGVARDGLPGGMRPVQLRVGASTTIGNYLMPERVAAFMRGAPEVAVDVQIGNTQEIAAAVARIDVDVGFVEGPCHEPDLQVSPWRDDALVIVCAPDHPLAMQCAAAPCDVAQLRQATWLLRESGSGTRDAMEHALLPHVDYFSERLLLGSTEAIKQAAACGLGLTCLSECAVRDLITLGRLVVLQTVLPPLSRRLYVIRHRSRKPSPRLLAFLQHCGEWAD